MSLLKMEQLYNTEYSNMKPVAGYQTHSNNTPDMMDQGMNSSGDEQTSTQKIKIPKTKREYLEQYK